MRVVLDAAARAEWLEAVARYAEANGEQAALRFIAAVQHAFDRIGEAPGSFPTIGPSGRLRKARVLRYPHSVIYVLTAEEARVIAVAHGKRDPGYWVPRL